MNEFSLIQETSYQQAIEELKNSIDTKQNKTYTINFKSDYQNSKIIRDFVGILFDAFHIFHPWRGRFILITDELINNAIEHGSQSNDINQCIITAGNQYENHDFHITIEIHDTGNGQKLKIEDFYDIKKDRTETKNGDVYMGKRGRGLFHITEKIVDKLSFSESPKGGLAVKIEKCIELENGDCSGNSYQKKSEN